MVMCHCRMWPNLRHLVLNSTAIVKCPIGPIDLLPALSIISIAPISKLELGTWIPADGLRLQSIGSLTRLTSLQLQLARGPHDLAPLQRLSQLRQLNLQAWVDGDGPWLPSSLQALTVAGNEGGSCDYSWLSTVQTHSQLCSLTFADDPDIRDCLAGPPTLEFAQCAQLTRLDGHITYDMQLEIHTLPRAIKMLQVAYEPVQPHVLGEPACGVDNDVAQSLAACTELEVLHMQWFGVNAFPRLPKLHTVCLRFGPYVEGFGDDVDHEEVEVALSSLPHTVTRLELVPYYCKNLSTQHLTHCVCLRELCLNGIVGEFDVDCEHLTVLTALTKLVLCTDPDAQSVYMYGFAFTHEEHLKLVPLQQLCIPAHAVERMQTLVVNGCKVIPL